LRGEVEGEEGGRGERTEVASCLTTCWRACMRQNADGGGGRGRGRPRAHEEEGDDKDAPALKRCRSQGGGSS